MVDRFQRTIDYFGILEKLLEQLSEINKTDFFASNE